mmetsp:Transcript_6341/g.9234  ORF Transcript_6341/g.9234 Transcript_6341/m.9234 type:complete len:477 (+) Transcript_6341:84-1514(+)
MGKIDVFKARLLNKIGKNDIDNPEDYTEKRQAVGNYGKHMSKINKKTKNWAQKSENAANLLYDLGDYVSTQALKEKSEFTETNLKIGELLKSTAEIQHSMLIKLVENIVIPAREYLELEKSANSAHRKYVDSSLKLQTAQKREATVVEKKTKNKDDDFNKAQSLYDKLDKKRELSCPTLEYFNAIKCCFDDSLYLYNDLKEQISVLEEHQREKREKYQEQKERKEAERRRKTLQKTQVDRDMIERLQAQTKALPTLPSADEQMQEKAQESTKPQDNSTESILARMRAEKDRIDKEKAAKRRSRAQTILRGMDDKNSPLNSKIEKATSNVQKIEPSQHVRKPRPPPRKASLKKSQPKFKYIGASMAAYQYDASEPTELSFASGDYILATLHDPEGWGTGISLTGDDTPKEYPSTYVSNFTPCEVTTALYDYNKSEDNEISFKEGDFINVLYKEEGWWLGEVNNQFGFFPQNYCKLGS